MADARTQRVASALESEPSTPGLSGRSGTSGVLIGVGVAGFLDETVFHQILHWHHFYDRGTPAMGLVSDGLFHAGSWLSIVIGLFLFADLHRRQATAPKRVWAGGLIGWGGFQVYDGLFQHKVLQIHQIRYHVDLLPYDVVWNLAGAVGIAIGVVLLLGAARSIAEPQQSLMPLAWLPAMPALGTAAFYCWGVLRLRARGDRWAGSRTVLFLTGDALALVAVVPPLADPPTFPLHVVQHLLLAMGAPLALALSAPVTLALRTLSTAGRAPLLTLVHSRVSRVLLWAPVVLLLETGGMWAYYLTGLFAVAEQQPWLHLAVHAHMFLAGCLFSWYLVGKDPARHRPSTSGRITVLMIAAAGHDVLAKLLHAWSLPAREGPIGQLHAGAELLFYGGDAIDLLLMTAPLTDWYTRQSRELARQRRRAAPSGR